MRCPSSAYGSSALNDALRQHRIRHADKARDVGTIDVADAAIGTAAVVHTGFVDALHDL